jgi:Tfp pilus assembly protein PilF
VLNLEPRHFGALAGRGMIFQRQKKYSAALEAFREALLLNPAMDQVRDVVKELQKQERGI